MAADQTVNVANYHGQGGASWYVGGSLIRGSTSKWLTESDILTPSGVSGLTPEERIGTLHHTRFTLVNVQMATVDATTSGAQGSVLLGTFPRGFIQVIGASSNITVAGDGVNITTNASIVMSVGTVAAAVDTTLTGTEANIIASTAASLTSNAGAFKGKAVSTAVNVDNSTTTNSTQMVARLNAVLSDVSSSANGVLTLNGTIDIFWMNFGDN